MTTENFQLLVCVQPNRTFEDTRRGDNRPWAQDRILQKPRYGEIGAAKVRSLDFSERVGIIEKFIIIAQLLPSQRIGVLVEECEQLCRIPGKSVSTAKANRPRSRDAHLPMTNRQ